MIVETFPVGMLQCNCTILGCETTKEAIVVDPGGEAERIKAAVEARGLKVVKIVHTHAHFDHVGATREVQEQWDGAETLLHEGDDWLIEGFREQPLMVGMMFDTGPPPRIDTALEGGMELRFGEQCSLVLHTPGHTPGSCCFSLRTPEGMLLLSGDTLFNMGVGRTDFPRGSYEQLQTSIRDQLLALDGRTRVIPGHGPETTIENERRLNPFLQ
ncbi:MAG TPA: MBL fold metallo-hydrolase [Planctomycetes bacterium]|nr:MBL fold metallo-hydrolase [Planctomycetota bacterium]